MKTKNPLYFVQGKDIEAVSGFFELMIKKLGLEPVMEMIKMMLKQVQSYPMLEAVNKFLSQLIERVLLGLRTLGFQL